MPSNAHHGQSSSVGRSVPAAPPAERRVVILGSTGSIGTQTLDVIEHFNALHARGEHPTRYRVVGLIAGRNGELLGQQAQRFGVARTALGRIEPGAAGGDDAAVRLVREVDCDLVVAAMVGASGLPATLAAVQMGRDVALANKETLVAAGSLIVPAARASGARLLPVDSEHSAVWQCLQGAHEEPGAGPHPSATPCPPMSCGPAVTRVVLTASGGPFRTWTREKAHHATPEQALAHPTWSMGAKVTIDSASLTNKAFEVIEAHWLFGLESSRIDVLIHPQSIVHSLVEYSDGNIIAQLGPPDMRAPIQYALTFPSRPAGRSRKLDLTTLTRLDFERPSLERFPALRLAYRVIDEGGTSGAVFNGASEEATNAFLAPLEGSVGGAGGGGATAAKPIAGRVAFGQIPELAQAALDALGVSPVRDLADVLEADGAARRFVRDRLGTHGS